MSMRAHGIVAFAAGVSMAVEMLTPRVLAPHVGTTVPVWAAAIGAALAGMAAGAALGGRLADRFSGRAVETAALALAAPAVALVPAIGAAAADGTGSIALRAWLAAAASSFLPSLLLGAVAPAVARAQVRRPSPPRDGGAPRVLGGLAAAGALGGLAGVWIAAEVLTSYVRTSVAFPLLGAACALAAVLRAVGRGQETAWDRVPAAAATPPPPSSVSALRLAPAALLCAVAGAATLAVEVLAARSTAVRAGSGTPTWTAVIGVALVGLAGGGALGGRLAARVPVARLLPLLLLAAGVATGVALALEGAAASVLSESRLPFRVRVAEAVALRFLPAFVALGALPPVLASAVLSAPARDGRRVGVVSAAGTLGATAAAIATAPALVPALGLEHAFAAVAATLWLCAAAAGAFRTCRREAVLTALALAALAATTSPLLRPREGTWVRDGAYARVVVDPAPAERAFGRDARRLWIDDRLQGYEDPADPTWLGSHYTGVVLSVAERALERTAAPRVLCVGGGSYSVPRALLAARPDARIDVVEIDPEVTRMARDHLGLADDPGFSVVHADARTHVRRGASGSYDFVFVDAFGGGSIPWHLTTREFFADLRRCTAAEGVVALNLIDVPSEGRLLSALRATMGTAFPRVDALVADPDAGRPRNVVLVATAGGLALDELVRADPARRGPPLPIARLLEVDLDVIARRARAPVLTDDHAPVDDLLEALYVRR